MNHLSNDAGHNNIIVFVSKQIVYIIIITLALPYNTRIRIRGIYF